MTTSRWMSPPATWNASQDTNQITKNTKNKTRNRESLSIVLSAWALPEAPTSMTLCCMLRFTTI